MTDNLFDSFDEIEDDEIFPDESYDEFEDEENYPTAEEYNRIKKQNYGYF